MQLDACLRRSARRGIASAAVLVAAAAIGVAAPVLIALGALAFSAPPVFALAALPPPDLVTVQDTPNDNGGSLTLTWVRPQCDVADNTDFHGYRIERATLPDGPFTVIADVPRGISDFVDADSIRDGVTYYYRIASRGGIPDSPGRASIASGPGRATAQWFHRGRMNALLAVIILSGLIIFFIEYAKRGGPIFIRKIAGLDAVDEAVGRATEMGRKILYIPGTSDMDNVMTLAGIAILGRVARMTAQYETPLEIPVSRSLVMVACRETVKEAYLAAGRPDIYNDSMVYYLTDDQFGYAAALEGIMVRDRPAAIFMQGSFYAEALILAETGNSIGAIQIAGTAQASQLPFFVAASDYTLLGEELFVAGAYLSKEPRQLGSLKGQDMGKAIILLLLLVGIIIQTTGLYDFSSLFVVQ